MAGLPQRLRRCVQTLIADGESATARGRTLLRTRLDSLLHLAELENAQLLARVISLSPQAVLDRGYAVVANGDGELIRAADQVSADDELLVRVGRGQFGVRALGDVATR